MSEQSWWIQHPCAAKDPFLKKLLSTHYYGYVPNSNCLYLEGEDGTFIKVSGSFQLISVLKCEELIEMKSFQFLDIE